MKLDTLGTPREKSRRLARGRLTASLAGATAAVHGRVEEVVHLARRLTEEEEMSGTEAKDDSEEHACAVGSSWLSSAKSGTRR